MYWQSKMNFDAQAIFGIFFTLTLACVFYRYTKRRAAAQATSADLLYSDLLPLLENHERSPGESIGSWKVTGRYRREIFQFHTITDTLSVRKLPSLWLLVTLPKPQALAATFDMMMRASGQTTFSKFDFLPHTLRLPEDFPPEAVLRSDQQSPAPENAMRGALRLFRNNRGKELLITPKGLRIVIQLAESEKARYGVYREARFSDARIAAPLAIEIMNTLLQLDQDLNA
jgi:hypothetical protein